MDGTLLDSKKNITDADRNAIRRFTELGGHFSVATGRTIQSFEQYLELLELKEPVIMYNGAAIHDFTAGKTLFTHPLPESAKKTALSILEAMPELGGEVQFGAQVTDIELDAAGCVQAVIVNGEERIEADAVFLGIGHSARDTYRMLQRRGLVMEPKAFAMGVRIEHPQELIDRNQYGVDAGHPLLPAADYALTFQDREGDGRGAYSFCMCPGGFVVAAASELGRVVTNGMSNYARDSGIANSALLVQVSPADFGTNALSGMALQEKLESLAFALGGSDYRAPVQSVGDFLSGRSGSTDFLVTPTYRPGVKPADLHDCLPDYITATLERALPHFNKKIPGFASADVPMTGIEARSSAPCRLRRDRATFMAEQHSGIYPIGEGAGYAGGIMSAAVDGLRAALAFLSETK